uniref:Uncharacterized protein n=1 Tax=Anguilla anguilla TaxID=7936 RepID=A0A0E9ULF0_ANGAN
MPPLTQTKLSNQNSGMTTVMFAQ